MFDDSEECRCPVCEQPFFDLGPCRYIVTTYEFGEESGWWITDLICNGRWRSEGDDLWNLLLLEDAAAELRPAVESLVEELLAAEEAGSPTLPFEVAGGLRRPGLVPLVEGSLKAGGFDSGAADARLKAIARRSPACVGYRTLTTDGMASDAFDMHYAEDAIRSGQYVPRGLQRDAGAIAGYHLQTYAPKYEKQMTFMY